jgi:hypothetical protein
LGDSVVATGAAVGFLLDGARSLHAAMDAVIATAVRIFVNRIEVDIGTAPFTSGKLQPTCQRLSSRVARSAIVRSDVGRRRRCGT